MQDTLLKEKNFEEAIENYLITEDGYKKGKPENLNRASAIDEETFLHFIKTKYLQCLIIENVFFMTNEEIFDKVRKIIVEQLGVSLEQVKNEATFNADLGADSLDVVEFIMALEEAFDIEIPDEEAEKLKNVGDVVSYIDSQLNK